jgi:hypothetical protein
MTEDFKEHYVSIAAAALVAAMRPANAKQQAAAVAEGEDEGPIETVPNPNRGKVMQLLEAHAMHQLFQGYSKQLTHD